LRNLGGGTRFRQQPESARFDSSLPLAREDPSLAFSTFQPRLRTSTDAIGTIEDDPRIVFCKLKGG